MTHGFTWTRRDGFLAVDDPHGKGTTAVNGVIYMPIAFHPLLCSNT